ncbi:MAG: hypothetical protein AAGE84_22190 [Cyanobacteria bacterium P01_G01_bin.39]
MKSRINQLIKIISTIIIIGALSLGCWNYYVYLRGESLPNSLIVFYRIGIVILIAHSIEALIVAIKASQNNYKPLNYAFYTFFVGFVGLQELLDSQSSAENND